MGGEPGAEDGIGAKGIGLDYGAAALVAFHALG